MFILPVLVSVTFLLMCVHVIFSSVSVLSGHLLEKVAHSVDHMFSLYFDYLED